MYWEDWRGEGRGNISPPLEGPAHLQKPVSHDPAWWRIAKMYSGVIAFTFCFGSLFFAMAIVACWRGVRDYAAANI
jgi:hypothetical protein